ncbi:NAD(P)-binding protein [Phialemonium atrogriseum]|uniref:NAD(P)-binding protein n=1 Tax=Phialemonium atrogriseum TaxID=1093897 RepID=A0AAJ0BS38_9PEZI|nr:NAD(P)-binding protein [Phialemonium atrogriseum]KAK1763261.1 NAD(P)-binding protein [Phialemonium atrogriseum]
MVSLAPKIYDRIYPYVDAANFKNAHEGKVVLITGAARGIGQKTALHFAMAGAATLVLLDLQLANLAETVGLCKAQGARALPYACDVSKQEQVDTVFDHVLAEVGGIDILINVAGVCNAKPILLETFSTIWRDIEINLGGVILTTMKVLPGMKARGRGCIINMASRAGTVTVPYLASYGASKAAVIKFTESVQKDLDTDGLGDKIQLYALHPGAVRTDLSERTMDPAVAAAYPEFAANRPKWVENFNTAVDLAGAVCVFLATGRVGNSMRGRYLDCEHDMEAFMREGAEQEILSGNLHTLEVRFLGGLPNDGGSSSNLFRFEE